MAAVASDARFFSSAAFSARVFLGLVMSNINAVRFNEVPISGQGVQALRVSGCRLDSISPAALICRDHADVPQCSHPSGRVHPALPANDSAPPALGGDLAA